MHATFKHKVEQTKEAKEPRVNRAKIPHISIDRYDQTNQRVSHQIYHDQDGENRCYGNTFGHDGRVSGFRVVRPE